MTGERRLRVVIGEDSVLLLAGLVMITAALATAISKLLSPPLYQTLAQRYAA